MRCSTENPLYAQWLLALRSLVLVTMVTAPVFFFRRFEGLTGTVQPPASSHVHSTSGGSATSGRPTTAAAAHTNDVGREEAFAAVKMGYPDVLYYLLTRGLVRFDAVRLSKTGVQPM